MVSKPPVHAARTEVSEEKTRAEVETLLRRRGASEFLCGHSEDTGLIAFRINGRQVRMLLPLPPESDRRFQRDGRGYQRAPAARRKAWEQDRRQRWRALLLALKAKFAAVEAGITTLEREFFADLLLPNNQTMAEFIAPQLERVYTQGALPALLPGLTSAREER